MMSQKEINEAEWRDARNWHGRWFGFYRSPRDTRAWVPKQNPAFGFTVNFARPAGVAAFVIILAVGIAIAVASVLLSYGRHSPP